MGRIKTLAGGLHNPLVVVSNRGAFTMSDTTEGNTVKPSVSGMVSAINPVIRQEGGLWISWGGRYGPENSDVGVSLPLTESNGRAVFQEVLLTPKEVEAYYGGFANSCLWPLCHNFIEKTVYDENYWQTYRLVNEKFARTVLKCTQPTDPVWVHDYHLALLPGYVRQYRPEARISLFWHIPFPPLEIFATMPWAKEIITGLLAAEFIGFHTKNYLQNFLQTAKELTGCEVDYKTGTIFRSGGQIKTAVAPIGINWHEFESTAREPEVIGKADRIREEAGKGKLILGVDRLDYTKGIPEKLEAFAWLLENCPSYRGNLTLIQIAVPTRTDVTSYISLKKRVEAKVALINSKYGKDGYLPVKYLYRSVNYKDLVAYYLAADMALVTPLKDGLNLVAKEYIAVKNGRKGVLVLSPFAGAASQLKEALIANPYSPEGLAKQIINGLSMPDALKESHIAALNRVIKEQDIKWWWRKIQGHWIGAARNVSSPPIKELWKKISSGE